MPRNELSVNSKYYLPKEDYLTALHFCLRYPTWEAILKTKPDTSKAISYDGEKVQTSGGYDPCSELAMKRVECSRKMRLVDETIEEVAPEIAHYLRLGVCYGMTEWQLEEMGMPCGHRMYYDRRRAFYWRIAQKI